MEQETVTDVQKPNVSNQEFYWRKKLGQALFYRPATSEVSYEALMIAFGQQDHWTVTNEADRAKIIWEPAPEGYWFWAEINPHCPRIGKIWDMLTVSIRLLSLEEYVIVWHAHKALTGKLLDDTTWNWTRTRFMTDRGSGALTVLEYEGRVCVDARGPKDLAFDFAGGGGRSSEVVNT